MMRALAAELERLRAGLFGLAARATVKLVADALKMQGVQLAILKDEDSPVLERFQQYGFTSHPKVGAEALVLHLGGSRDHGVVIAVDDRRYRLTALAEGEVALYDDQGSRVHLVRADPANRKPAAIVIESGLIELGAGATEPVVLGQSFAALFNAHTHPTPNGPSGPPATQMGVGQLSTVAKVTP